MRRWLPEVGRRRVEFGDLVGLMEDATTMLTSEDFSPVATIFPVVFWEFEVVGSWEKRRSL